MAASVKWLLQLHRDVPKAARFYSQGLDFTVNVCTLRWAELQSGPFKLALMQHPQPNQNSIVQKGCSSMLSFTVTDINNTVTKLIALGAELDGSIKYEIHGKVAETLYVKYAKDSDNSWTGPLFNRWENLQVAALRCIDGHMLGLHEPV